MLKPEGKIIGAVQHITADTQNCFRSFLTIATSFIRKTLGAISNMFYDLEGKKMNDLLVYTDDPSKEEIEFIKNGLKEYNDRIVGDDNHKVLSIVVKDKNENIIGGIIGGTYWEWLYIDRFWIRDEYRKKGIGTRLLKKIEEEAIKRGCKNVHLDVHDFQALEFYIKNGYIVKSELKDLPIGHSKYLLWKYLK